MLIAHRHAALGEIVLLEECLDRLQIVARGHVHDSEVFVIKAAVRGGTVLVALDQVVEHLAMRRDMAVGVHRDERGELQETRIDPAECASVPRRYARRHVPLEPFDRVLLGEPGDDGRRCPGVDRAAHQRHAARLRRVVARCHERDRRNYRRRRLAHRDDVRFGPKVLKKTDDRLDIAAEVEIAVQQGHDLGIAPVGHEYLEAGVDHVLHRAAQQGRVMPAHRRNQQDAPSGRARRLKPQQPDERLVQLHALRQRLLGAAAGFDVPRRLAARAQHVVGDIRPCDGGTGAPVELFRPRRRAQHRAGGLCPCAGRQQCSGGCVVESVYHAGNVSHLVRCGKLIFITSQLRAWGRGAVKAGRPVEVAEAFSAGQRLHASGAARRVSGPSSARSARRQRAPS